MVYFYAVFIFVLNPFLPVGDKDGSKVTTVVATPGQGPDRPQEVSYTDTKVIGNGSFGVVYQAKLCDSGELVAIKKVLQDKRFKVKPGVCIFVSIYLFLFILLLPTGLYPFLSFSCSLPFPFPLSFHSPPLSYVCTVQIALKLKTLLWLSLLRAVITGDRLQPAWT